MYKPTLKINVGVEEYVIASVEGCLKDIAGTFYSTQNAFRVHEWLRGTETAPLVLEANAVDGAGVLRTYRLGDPKVAAYPERYYPGQLLKLEQLLLAMPAIQELMRRNLDRAANNEPGSDPVAFSATMERLMEKVHLIQAFNASSMYFSNPIPQRACMETLETLNILFTCIITQREKRIYESKVGRGAHPSHILPNMFNQMELDKVIGRIHESSMMGFFPHPAYQAKLEGLLDDSFYRQCAMAFSAASTIPIPVAYFEPEETQVFHWATKVLHDLKNRIPSFQVRPKIQTVTPLFKTNQNGQTN